MRWQKEGIPATDLIGTSSLRRATCALRASTNQQGASSQDAALLASSTLVLCLFLHVVNLGDVDSDLVLIIPVSGLGRRAENE